MRHVGLTILLISSVCSGQTSQRPVAPNEIRYLRFMLLNVASLDHGPEAIKSFEDALVKQFGLSRQESDVIHSAGQSLKPVLAQLRQSSRALVAGKAVLSPADAAALASLNEQREQIIVNLANQILNSVSPGAATRLRVPGRILPNRLRKN